MAFEFLHEFVCVLSLDLLVRSHINILTHSIHLLEWIAVVGAMYLRPADLLIDSSEMRFDCLG